ncbi:MAG: hypothetical protein ACJ8FY_24300 [Gemmataceae bacterium]
MPGRNTSNVLQMRRLYLSGADQLFARIVSETPNVPAWYLTDRLGSVRDIAAFHVFSK